MTRGTGTGRAAVLVAALLPAACMQTVMLKTPDGSGQGGNSAFIDGGGVGDGSSGVDREGGGHDPGCSPGSAFQVLNNNVRRPPPSIVIALDHSNAMNAHFGNSNNGTRLSVVQNALLDRLGKYGPIIRFGYVEFPGVQQRGGCSSMSGCCVGKVSQPVPESENGIMAVINQCAAGQSTGGGGGCINSDATPTAMALSAVNDTYTALGTGGSNSSWPRYTLLISGSEPSCGTSMAAGDACDQATNEIAKLNIMAIPTYVVGIGDVQGPVDANGGNLCMNELASASGIVRSNVSPFYFPATTEEKFTSYLNNIVTLAACHLEIDDNNFTDPNLTQIAIPNAMGVTTTIAHDPTRTNGWEFERSSVTRIALFGTACTDFLNTFLPSGSLNGVRVQACTGSSHP